MVNKKILGLIGLAARARKLSAGADIVEIQIKKKKVHLIIIAEEASERTKTKFIKLGDEYHIDTIILGNIEELSKAIGKNNKAVLGIEDMSFARELEKINNGGEIIG